MSIRIGRIALAFLVLALITGSVALPASANRGGAVVAKSKSKCKKKAKRAVAAKKKKCKRGGGGGAATGLPGQATHPTPTQPNQPTEPTQPPPPAARQMGSVTVADNPVLATNSTSGQVTISGKAPAGGQSVALNSSVSARVKVPDTVVVVAGETTASFSIHTTVGGPVTATLTGSIGSSAKTTQLSVVDRPSVASVKLQRKCFAPTPMTWPINRVTLDIPAPADTDVALESSDTDSLFLPLTTVTVPSGSTSAFFTVNALAPPAVPGPVTVTATAPSTPPQSDSASVYETPPDPQAADLTLDPSSVVQGDSSTGTVTLTCEVPADSTVVVTLASDAPEVDVPPSVTLAEGELSADFPISTHAIPDSGKATISATAGGATAHADLTVTGQPD